MPCSINRVPTYELVVSVESMLYKFEGVSSNSIHLRIFAHLNARTSFEYLINKKFSFLSFFEPFLSTTLFCTIASYASQTLTCNVILWEVQNTILQSWISHPLFLRVCQSLYLCGNFSIQMSQQLNITLTLFDWLYQL